MNRRVMLAIATVLSFVGVLGLYFYSCSLEPAHIQLADIGTEDVGNVVRTSGFVTDQYSTSGGDIILELSDYEDGGTISIYIPASVVSSIDQADSLLPGTEVEVVGQVQEYMDELELTVSSGDGLRILRSPDEVEVTIETLARIPELFEGHEVTVGGQIRNMKSSGMWTENGVVPATLFQLRYSGKRTNYTMDCLIIGHDVSRDFHQGQPVKFTGVFEYHESEAKYRIESEEMTLHS